MSLPKVEGSSLPPASARIGEELLNKKDSPRPPITQKVDSPRPLENKEAVKSDDKKVGTKDGRVYRALKIAVIVAAAVIGVLALAALVVGVVAMIWPAVAAAVAGAIGTALSFVAAHALPFVITGAVGLGVSAAAITAVVLFDKKFDKGEKKADDAGMVKDKSSEEGEKKADDAKMVKEESSEGEIHTAVTPESTGRRAQEAEDTSSEDGDTTKENK